MEITINGCVSPLDKKNTTDANAATDKIPHKTSNAISDSLLIFAEDFVISEKQIRLTQPQIRHSAHFRISLILATFLREEFLMQST